MSNNDSQQPFYERPENKDLKDISIKFDKSRGIDGARHELEEMQQEGDKEFQKIMERFSMTTILALVVFGVFGIALAVIVMLKFLSFLI